MADSPPTHDHNHYKYIYCSKKENVTFHTRACSMIVKYMKKGNYINKLEIVLRIKIFIKSNLI